MDSFGLGFGGFRGFGGFGGVRIRGSGLGAFAGGLRGVYGV